MRRRAWITAATLSLLAVGTHAATDSRAGELAVAFVGDDLAVAPHQLATPQMQLSPTEDMEDSYGGGAESIPPIVHRLATLAGTSTPALQVTALAQR